MRRFKNEAARARNRAYTIRNLGHWCNGGGAPLAIMDDPTEDHVKALLLVWLTPRAILDQAALALKEQYDSMADQVLLKVLTNAARRTGLPDDLTSRIWGFMNTLAEAPILKPPVDPIKVWSA